MILQEEVGAFNELVFWIGGWIALIVVWIVLLVMCGALLTLCYTALKMFIFPLLTTTATSLSAWLRKLPKRVGRSKVAVTLVSTAEVTASVSNAMTSGMEEQLEERLRISLEQKDRPLFSSIWCKQVAGTNLSVLEAYFALDGEDLDDFTVQNPQVLELMIVTEERSALVPDGMIGVIVDSEQRFVRLTGQLPVGYSAWHLERLEMKASEGLIPDVLAPQQVRGPKEGLE